MVRIFYDAIIAKTRVLSEAPISIRSQVHNMLLVNGYDDNGDKIVVVTEQ